MHMRIWGLMLCFIPSIRMLFSNVPGSLIATSENVIKPLQFLSGKCVADYCLRTCYFLIIIMSFV